MKILQETQTRLINNKFFAISVFSAIAIFFTFTYLFIGVSHLYAVDCTIPKSGTVTISSTCNIPTNGLVNGSTTVRVLGADGSGISITSGSMTVNSGVTLVWGPGSSITRSASTTLFNATGAQITQKYVCFYDPDGDLAANDYATTTQGGTAVIQDSSSCSGNYRRQNTLSGDFANMNNVAYDQSPGDAACYNQTPCYSSFYPGFYPGFYPSFYPSFYPYQTFYPAFYPTFYPYQSFYPSNYGSFYPAFYPGFYPYQSFYPGFNPYFGFYPSNYAGFYPYQSFYPGCFLEGTKVLMADGTSKNIEDISRGEIIMSYDLSSNKKVANTVIEKYTHPDYPDYLIINESLKVTTNHRIWVNNTAWARADELRIGDVMSNSSGEAVVVSDIELKSGNNTVYNLHLQSENHNYFADGILVHNGKQ